MNNARSFFWIALAALGFLLWNAWQNDYQRTQPLAPTAATGAVELLRCGHRQRPTGCRRRAGRGERSRGQPA
jgi:hypothetical protein